ncbi:MAG: aminoglycoside phosphotransferase [Alphaproteobacteria bacterium]|nr:aminoglycoside phosphotransferase [Alphaproteobacteria bacterium]
MSERGAASARFLVDSGWGAAERRPLAGDASFRHYERLSLNGRTAVLMDAPPPKEDVRPFLAIARHLAALGYSAPGIMAASETEGFVLLEDLGDDLYTRILARGADSSVETELYAAAIDLLADLHRHAPPEGVARYDEAKLIGDAELFLDWYVPRRLEREARADERRRFRDAWRAILPAGERMPLTLALRDFHADNLIWLPRRRGVQRVGLLDFQDAIITPLPYDLVSLLEDARRDVPPDIVTAMIERYLAARPELDRSAFAASYAVMGAQRNIRIIGVFARLAKRDSKPRYLEFLPRIWRLVEHDLSHPALRPIADWMNAMVPAAMRERDR